jgi:hypothetical protein
VGPHELKLIETTVQFLQYMTSVFLVILSASGVAFYYYWTNKLNGMSLINLWPFGVPVIIVFMVFCFIGYLYSALIAALSKGAISDYVIFWSKYAGCFLWGGLFFSILALSFAFINIHRRL